MTPEQELLLRCTEPPGHDGIAGLVALLDRERIDWSAFVQFAALQGLGPVVYRRLRTCCPDRIPVKEMERLRVLHFANSARTLFHTRVLGAILSRMESCGVRAIPFKGPVLAAQIYGATEISERHRHRYEFANAYREPMEAAGMVLSGFSPDSRLVEVIELPDHPFFIACQFHPELKSRPNRPHPLFLGLVKSALEYQQGKGLF